MNAAFIAAVVDTLLPGDSGGSAGEAPLPNASAACIEFSAIANAHDTVLQAVAKEAGGADAFITADEPVRIAAVKAVERVMPEAFRALLSTLLADYYESQAVLNAMEWRYDPPQPRGHEMQPRSHTLNDQLNRVRNYRKLWRE